MVNAGHAIGTGRPFIKNKGSGAFPQGHTFFKSIIIDPIGQYILLDGGQIQLRKLFVLSTHNSISNPILKSAKLRDSKDYRQGNLNVCDEYGESFSFHFLTNLYILIALFISMINKIMPTSPHTALMFCFTTASITMATRKIVATSFHIRS